MSISFIPGEPCPEVKTAGIIGQCELGEFLRVKQSTVNQWAHRTRNNHHHMNLPEPDYQRINRVAAWRRLTIVMWAAQTGHLPPWLETEAQGFVPERRQRRSKASV